MGTGVGIPHDDGESGADKSLFGEDGMADTVGAHIKEVLDVVAACPIPESLALFSGLGVLGR